MSDLTDFINARLNEREDDAHALAKSTAPNAYSRLVFLQDYLVSARGLVNLHRDPQHDCPGRDYDGHRIPDYEQDCPTLMLLAHPYRFHPDWRGEWKA